MSDPDIVGSFTSEPTITGQFEPDIVIQGNVDQQFPAQISVASVTTGDPGTDASVVNVGTPGNARLQFTIPRGNPGIEGDPGPANSLTIGTVDEGATADATITGDAPDQVLNLTLPKGDAGDAATIEIGMVTTVSSGSPATVENVGTDTAAIFNFGIPKGADGVVQSLVAGSNITIDATDPANPVINSTASGSGDVVGPASATDGHLAQFDGTTGKLIEDSGKAISDFATAAQGALADSAVQDIAAVTHAATSKTTPVDADELPLVDSAASNVLKKLTWANLKAGLAAFVGDSGSGGTKGVVPAPASGDAAAGKYLKADGTWSAPAGTTGAWTTYTPTVGSGTGTITTASATGRYKQLGKTVFVEMTIAITTNGTGGAFVTATLPTGLAAAADTFFGGKARAVSGKLIGAAVQATGSTLAIGNYDNSYPGANGEVIVISGVYETN